MMIPKIKYENNTGLPSVSDILDVYIDKRWFKEEHSRRGQLVHHSLAAHLLCVWAPKLPQDIEKYVESGKRWIDENVDKVILVEKRLSHKDYGFTGQLDLVAILKRDDLRTLIDFKSSQAAYKYWSYSTAGYKILYDHNGPVNDSIQRRMAVRVRREGTGLPALENIYKDDEYDMAVFSAAITMYNAFK